MCGAIIHNAAAQNVGIGTTTPLARLHITDSAVLFSSSVSSPPFTTTINPPMQGAGTRTMWFPALGAFRTGYVDGSQWDRDSMGQLSFAAGANSKAKGNVSFALGYNTKALNSFAISMGGSTTASGIMSTSMGGLTVASGAYSTAMGFGTTASGFRSTAIGDSSIASGESAVAMGQQTIASGLYSTATGRYNTASGNTSFIAGYNSTSSGEVAIALGRTTSAIGRTSFSAGNNTVAKASGSTVFGAFNDDTDSPDPVNETATDRIFQLGNGDRISHARSNAITVLRNGKVGIGTTSPEYPLHVQKSAANIFAASIENQDAAGWGLEVRTADAGSTRNALEVYTGGISRFLVRNDGNVGIGNIDPGFRFDLSGRMRIRSGGDLNNSAGIFLNNTLNTDIPAFIGMQSDDQVGFYGNTSGWSFVMNTGNGNIGIGTITPSTKLEVNGYTKLGSDAPAVKVKKITGTTASTEGGNTNIPHGLAFSKILSVSVLVESATNTYTPPSSTHIPGIEYNYDVYNNTIWIFNTPGNSGNILSKPFKVFITYEE